MEKKDYDYQYEDILDEEEIEQYLEEAIDDKNTEKLTDLIEQVYPIDLAMAMEDYENDDLAYIIDNTDDETLASIVEQADVDLSSNMVNIIEPDRLINLFELMSNDDIADIVGEMNVAQRKEIVNLMKHSDRKAITELLGYSKTSAGGRMTTEYISVNENWTIDKVIDKIKEIGPTTEVIDTIFAVNNRGQFVGSVDLRDILIAAKNSKLKEIVDFNAVWVTPYEDQEEVANMVSKYDLRVIPVLNSKKVILGIITVDDIIDVINEEHTEDMLLMGGASAEEDIDSTVGESIRMRLPWLAINLVTAFAASFIVSMFEGTIAQVTALAAAMPIVTGMGGNAGSQQLAIMIRAIALDEIDMEDALPLVMKQVFVGVFNGAVIGFLAGIVLYFMYGNPYLGIIIFIAMIFNLVMAAFVGVMVPMILEKLNLDPALASAIFITTATDIFGFFVFLGMATLLIEKLL